MASRPLVQVYASNGKVCGSVPTPQVLLSPIRHDIVRYVQSNLRKNKRQAYAVNYNSGMQSSAMSWGTGRAVARIPRVPGGGTHRAGQGAFGNMCRGGRIFAPARVWRRWHRKVNINQKRYAIASALAASAVPALVMARGHNIQKIPEVPLVIENRAMDPISKTKEAVRILLKFKAYSDVRRVERTERKRGGRSKWRNRPKTRRVGPLIIQGNARTNNQRAFRNLPGCEVVSVIDLNLLRLAPGGHLGRFIIWTESAFRQLDLIWGTNKKQSAAKKGYWLPRPILTNPDLARIFNSDQVAQCVRARRPRAKAVPIKPNYIKNKAALVKLNPYYLVQRRLAHRRAHWNKIAKERKRELFKAHVRKLRSVKTKEGKASYQLWKLRRIHKIRRNRHIQRTRSLQYRRVINGEPKKVFVKHTKKEKKAAAKALLKKKEDHKAKKAAARRPKKVWVNFKKEDRGKGKGKVEARGRHKQRLEAVAAKAAKAAEKKNAKQ